MEKWHATEQQKVVSDNNLTSSKRVRELASGDMAFVWFYAKGGTHPIHYFATRLDADSMVLLTVLRVVFRPDSHHTDNTLLYSIELTEPVSLLRDAFIEVII